MFQNRFTRRDFLKLLGFLPVQQLLRIGGLSGGAGAVHNANNEHPNFLVLVFDALSACNMSLYGYARSTTPNLDRLAARGTVYHRHYAAGNYTSPGTASLLTATYPWTHRSLHYRAGVLDALISNNIFQELASTHYTTAYTHNNMVNPLFYQFRDWIDEWIPTGAFCLLDDRWIDKVFAADFPIASYLEERLCGAHDRLASSLVYSLLSKARHIYQMLGLQTEYRERFPKGISHNYNDQVFILEDAMDGILAHTRKSDQPFFAYYHLYAPHGPYNTRYEFLNRFADGWKPPNKPVHRFSTGQSEDEMEQLRQAYDEYLAYVDEEFGRLFRCLEEAGLLENTYLIVTSDHGESFERGIFAHLNPTLFDPLLHIPLLIFKPGQQNREDIFIPTSCVDILPTILHLNDQAIPAWVEGDILPTFKTNEPDPKRSIYVLEAKGNSKFGAIEKGSAAVIKGPYKLVRYFGYEGYEDWYEMYNLETDPEELKNIYKPDSSIASELMRDLKGKFATK